MTSPEQYTRLRGDRGTQGRHVRGREDSVRAGTWFAGNGQVMTGNTVATGTGAHTKTTRPSLWSGGAALDDLRHTLTTVQPLDADDAATLRQALQQAEVLEVELSRSHPRATVVRALVAGLSATVVAIPPARTAVERLETALARISF